MFLRTVPAGLIMRVILIIAMLTMPAHARIKITPETKRACGGDVVRFCLSETVGKNRYQRTLNCLKREREKLSPDCAAIIK